MSGSEHGEHVPLTLKKGQSAMGRLVFGEAFHCLVRNGLGIFPLTLVRLSPVGATLAFRRSFDRMNFKPGQQVVFTGGDRCFDQIIRERVGVVQWVGKSEMGVKFDRPVSMEREAMAETLAGCLESDRRQESGDGPPASG